MSETIEKPNTFSADIRELIVDKEMEVIDAVIFWCEMNNVEVEYAAAMIKRDPYILSQIQVEAEDLNFLKKGARLPI